MGGIEAAFQFFSYKIDRIDLKLSQHVDAYLYTSPIHPNQVQFEIGIRNPQAIRREGMYIGGMDCRITLFETPKLESELVSGEMGIAGVFKVEDRESLPKEAEDYLVRIQIPALLFPYLRAALTNSLASSGFGGVYLPLINVHEIARNSDLNIIELDNDGSGFTQ